MIFRPAFWMTIATVPALILLLGLGGWQLWRLEWKQQLIADFESRALAEAVAPPAEDAAILQYQRLRASGVFLHGLETAMTGKTFEGTAGYHIITPLQLDDGRILLVNRGWVAEDYRNAESRPSSLPQGQQRFEGILRLPQQQGRFVPDNDPEGGFWFTVKPDEIARHHGLGDAVITAYTIDALRDEGPLILPIGASVEIEMRNEHLQYALTWFGLALGLIGVYLSWHHQTGRLRFSRPDEDR